MIPAAVD